MKRFALTLSAALILAATAAAQLSMPARQVSVATNDWTYLEPVLPTAQSVLDFLDTQVSDESDRIGAVEVSSSNALERLDLLEPRVGLLETNHLSSATLAPGADWAVSAESNVLAIVYSSNLVYGIEVDAPGATVVRDTNGVVQIGLTDSFAAGYASQRYLDTTFTNQTRTLAASSNAYVVLTNGTYTVSDTNVLTAAAGALTVQSPGVYFVHAGAYYYISTNTFSSVYLHHRRGSSTVALWPVIGSTSATPDLASISIVAGSVAAGDYFEMRLSNAEPVGFTAYIGYVALEGLRLYSTEE
jgi:hypothetical protein